MNITEESDDEFGDSSFLMEVDLDAISAAAAASAAAGTSSSSSTTKNVASSKTPPATATKTTTTSGVHINTNVNDNNGAAKRRKISISPAICSNRSNQQNNDDEVASQVHLEKTLSQYFGYPKFRSGQLQVIQTILRQDQDVAVFWATGGGKSLCYQVPALHSGKISIVVSPLISLMQDQVYKLNGLMPSFDDTSDNHHSNNNRNHELATFLGSGQADMTKERGALQGEFLLIYVTPEKLLSSGFLRQLATLHTTKREIGLFAIDEAHCVSEWGHDFRKEYRRIGEALRTQAAPELRTIPIMALTATAVPRVQEDICKSLYLRNAKHFRMSFDRSNLVISVVRKDRGMALAAALEPLVQSLTTAGNSSVGTRQQQSTIIYVPTRNQVEEVVQFLKQRLQQQQIDNHFQVEGYHAGLSLEERNAAHTNFLVGKTTVICATVAFGMGIDKIDTRRVIHFGPPQTVESYYQQIGRAGRDGLKAECILYYSENDFDKYRTDFYLGGLNAQAKSAVLASLSALKSYAIDSSTCRRKALLDFFHESPAPFGEFCKTCDICQRRATLPQEDLERDFGLLGARVVLQAIDALNEQSISTVINLISGKTVENFRLRHGMTDSAAKQKIQALKGELKATVTQEGYRDLIILLNERGYLKEASKSATVNGFSRSWTTYSLTPKGKTALTDKSASIILSVPESILEAERVEKARRERVLEQLEKSGVKLDKLPEEEIQAGDGDVIRAYSKWNTYKECMLRTRREDRITQLESLLDGLQTWRAEAAIKYRMAPTTVLAEHTLLHIAYTAGTMPAGMKFEESTLLAAGVRSREINSLCQVINQWVDKHHHPTYNGDSSANSTSAKESVPVMQLVPGETVKARKNWEYAVYKPNKKTGLASWESSYNRFSNGESPQAIALSPENGRPIQVQTVCGHIMQALLYGKPVDLHRLAQFLPPPTSHEWDQLYAAEISTSIDVCGNPVNSGIGGGKLTKTDLLKPIMGEDFSTKSYNERSEEEKAKFQNWCNRLEWYMTLRRIGHEVSFTPSS